MGAQVLALRKEFTGAAGALAALDRHLDRCSLAANSVKAYRRQARAFVDWLNQNAAEHGDAFQDTVGAEAAVTAWRRSLLVAGRSAATVNQALSAVTLLFQVGANLKIAVKLVTLPPLGRPLAFTKAEAAAIERESIRRGPRDAAIIAILLYVGLRAEECASLHYESLAFTAKTGTLRVIGKGDQPREIPVPKIARDRVNDYLEIRGREPGPLWTGQRGALTKSGVTQLFHTICRKAGIHDNQRGGEQSSIGPHRARHTFATRLRQSGADQAQIQALLGHTSPNSSARYFRPGIQEQTDAVEAAFS
jgi:integrase